MRVPALLALLLMAACSANPAAFGITGAPPPTPPSDSGPDHMGLPGEPGMGNQYAPSVPANTGAGRFWGYN